ncbi:kunitz-type serine protease inhibitor 2 [Musca domestica]|uniref:Kunitz-type serine protease inhibitor 2 n=1 Tax=Musca domestica TaxID=7370 RepID=A0A1I8MP73_MUSDO|nr:kunitz-type serine protease inhibitor 2 [Musca domestica]
MKIIYLLFLFAIIASLCCTIFAATIDICQLEHSADGVDGSSCIADMQSYTYNSNTNECIVFIYGGCGGNANRFRSREECTKTCLK